MEKLKENPGLLVAGLGAIVAAGIVMYAGKSGKKAKKDLKNIASSAAPVEETIETMEEEEDLENSFFIDSKLTSQDVEKLIVKWMKDQIDSLLHQNIETKLNVTDRKLNQDDYYRVMMII